MLDPVTGFSMWKARGPEMAAMSPLGVAPTSAAKASDAAAGAEFGAMLADLAGSTVDALKAGEAAAINGLQGKASVQEVVRSVMAAEQTLQSAIAIRDKAVAAYMELSRMSI